MEIRPITITELFDAYIGARGKLLLAKANFDSTRTFDPIQVSELQADVRMYRDELIKRLKEDIV